jgi:hypothetical protein
MLKLVSRFVLEVLTALIVAIVVPGSLAHSSMEISRVH